ncbi:replication initiation protein (plasmid) [Pseudarthrobacter sp. P1]|uniref:replication initiation protein n=1 Tax=Pseudarthrobacter sp. P1 TaxID=3418418 RepID=UPI003CFA2747
MTMTAERWLETYRQKWPMATDHDKGRYPHRQTRSEALQRRYIQANPSALTAQIVIDLDHEDSLSRALELNGVPTPNYVAQSPSGRAHVAYLLKAPVCRTDNARLEPMRFVARVEAGLVSALRADLGYAGFMTKNPIHDDWDTVWTNDHLWTLKELATQLPGWLPHALPRRAAESSGLARNVTLFNRVRLWSYRAILRHRDGGISAWEEVTHAYALAVNQEFPTPLATSEVRHLARSVSRWTWRNLTAEGFTKLQRERGRKGGAATAAIRSAEKTITDELIRSMAL